MHIARNSYDIAKDFAPWFLTIARGRAIDAIRKKARIKEIAAEDAGQQKVEWSVQSEGLSLELLNGLSERDRDILRRVYFDGEDEATVAVRHGVSLGNFRVLTHRLRRRVKQLLEEG